MSKISQEPFALAPARGHLRKTFAVALCVLIAGHLPFVEARELTDEEENNLHAFTIGALGTTNIGATAVSIVAEPVTALAAEYTALIANNSLKLVPAVLQAPGNRFRTPNADESCVYEFDLPQSVAKYSNTYGLTLSPLPEDWGELGEPDVIHSNSEVYVYPRSPFIEGPLQEGQTVRLPAGSHQIRWQADTLWDPVFDYAIPTVAALWNTKKLEANLHAAAVAKQVAKAREALPFTKRALLWVADKLKIAVKKCINPSPTDLKCPAIYIDSITETEEVSATKFREQTFTVYDVRPPVLTINEPLLELEATDIGGTLTRRVEDQIRDGITSFDPCDRLPTLGNDLPDLLPLGETTVTWTVTDLGPNQSGGRNSVTKTQRIRVADTQAPIMIPPPGKVLEVDPNGSNGTGLPLADVALGGPRVVDLADPEPTVSSTAPEFFPINSRTPITWTATDSSGNAASDNQLITVKALGTNTAPSVTNRSVTTRTSEPVDIVLTGTDTDEIDGRFDPLAFKILDRPDNGEFVAPLLPYFIEDFRTAVQGPYGQAFATTGNRANWLENNVCKDPSLASLPRTERIRKDWVYAPRFIHVFDDGTYFLIDQSWQCGSSLPATTDRISKWSKTNEFLGQIQYTGTNDAFVPDQDGFIYVINRLSSGSGEMTLIQTNPNFEDPDSNPPLDSWSFRGGATTNADLGLNDPLSLSSLSYARLDSRREVIFMTDRRRVFVYDARGDLTDGEGTFNLTMGERYRGALKNTEQFLCTSGSWSDSNEGFVMDIDDDGNFFIIDSCQDRIHRFEPTYFDADGELIFGDYVGWAGRCDASTNNACDVEKGRSRGFSCTDATCSVTSTTAGDRAGQFDQPRYMSIDPNGVLYVADQRRVQRFAPDGTFAGEARSTGTGINQGERPGFVLGNLGEVKAVSVNSTNFFVVDQAESFINVFETTPLKDITDISATVTYVSNLAFSNRTDTFTYQASDGLADSNVGTVSVRVNRNFRAPEAFAATISLDEDTATEITLTGDDPDGVIGTDDVFPLDTLSFEVTKQPDFGVLEGEGVNWTYTPAPNYTGPDSIEFVVSDGLLDSTPATISLDVRSVNDTPVITSLDLPERVAAGFPVVLRSEFEDDGAAADNEYTSFVLWGGSENVDVNGEFVDPDGEDGPLAPELNGLIVSEPIGGKSDRTSTEFGRGTVFGEYIYADAGQTQNLRHCIIDGEHQVCEDRVVAVESLANLAVELTSEEQITNTGFIDLDLLVSNLQPEAGVPGLVANNVTLWQVPDTDFNVSIRSGSGNCQISNGRLACTAAAMQPGDSFSAQLRVTPASGGPVIYDLEVPVAVDVSTTTDSVDDSYNALRWVIFQADPTDSDGDGMTDTYESTYGLNPNSSADASADADEDGLSNLEEFNARTDPRNADSDGDSIPDNVDTCPLDPSGSADFDADGICEAVRDLSPENRSRMLKFIQLFEALEDR